MFDAKGTCLFLEIMGSGFVDREHQLYERRSALSSIKLSIRWNRHFAVGRCVFLIPPMDKNPVKILLCFDIASATV